MYLSTFSLFTALFWVTVFTSIISVLRKRMLFLQNFSLHAFFILLSLCMMRILLPLELPYTIILDSKKIMPVFLHFFKITILKNDFLHITMAHLLAAVWIAGVSVFFAIRIIEYHGLKHALNMFPVSDNERLYQLLAKTGLQESKKNVRIIVHKSFTAPASVGYIHPVILLPDICLDDEELLGILIHESAHLQFKHLFIKLAMELICICFWWYPFLRRLASELAHALEMHSDQAVCAKLDQEQQKKYLNAIMKVFLKTGQTETPSAFTCCLFENRSSMDLQQRFRMILGGYYKKKEKKLPMIIAFALCIFLSSYIFIPQPYCEPTLEDYGPMEIPPENQFFYIKTDDGYDLYEYPERFLDHIQENGDCLPYLKIYKNIEDVKRK